MPLNEDIQSNLRLLQMVASKASLVHCNVGSLRGAATAILVIARDCAHNPEVPKMFLSSMKIPCLVLLLFSACTFSCFDSYGVVS